MANDKLHSGHRERVRQRFIETGASGFQAHEILELMLFYALPRVNTNETGHRLIDEFQTFANVMNADIHELEMVDGISTQTAVFLSFLGDLCRYYATSSHTSSDLSTADKAKAFFIDYFSSISSELYVIAVTDMELRIISTHSFPLSFFAQSSFEPRCIAETLLRSRAYQVIIGHNHIDRIPLPDDEDYRITKLLTDCFNHLNIITHDHIICGGGKAFSMRESGAFSF